MQRKGGYVMPYTPINDEILARLTAITGSKNVLTDNDAIQS